MTAGTLTIGSGSVTDSSGAISFGNENLTTTGIVTAAGTSVFTNLDISGDIDVDGTTNLDVVDIDGAVDMASTLGVTGATTFSSSVNINSASYDNRQVGIDAGGFYIYNVADSRYDLQTSDIGGLTTTPAAGGHAVFNQSGIDADFRVESDTIAHALFVDGASGNVSIGSSTAYGTSKLTLFPATNPTTASSSAIQLSIGESSQNSAYSLKVGYINIGGGYSSSIQSIAGGNPSTLLLNADGGNVGIGTAAPARKLSIWDTVDGYNLELQQRSAYNSGNQSGVVFSAKYHSDGSTTDLASIRGGKENTTDNNYAGKLAFFTRPNGGSDTERMRIESGGGISTYPAASGTFVINEGGVDADFRVESDTKTHALFLDGESGIFC